MTSGSVERGSGWLKLYLVRLGANVAKFLKLVRCYKIFRVFLAVGVIFKIRMAAKSLQPQ